MKLNGKKLTNAVVLSLMLAAPFYASAEEIIVSDGQVLTGPQNANANIATTIKGSGTENITFEGDADKQFSLSASGVTSEIKDVNDIAITGIWGGDNSGFYTNGANSKIEISANGDITAYVSGKNNNDRGPKVFHAMGGTITVSANNIDIFAGGGNAVFAQTDNSGNAGNIVLNAKGDINLESTGAIAVGAGSLNKENTASTVSITGKNVNITSDTMGVAAYGSYGNSVFANSNKVSINAEEKLVIDAKTAIFTDDGKGEGEEAGVNVAAKNIEITGAITADKNGNITVGDENLQQAVISSDVTANDNSNIDLNLGTNGSLTGTVTISDNEANGSTVDLNMGNNSVWKVTGDSAVTTIDGSGATVSVDNTDTKITVGNNKSTGLTLKGSSNVTNSFDANNISEGMQNLADVMEIQAGNKDITVTAEEGDILGEITAVTDENGNIVSGSVKQGENVKNAGITELANVAFMAWRAENDEMHQRMGELRSSTGEAGIWARMKRGESESGDLDITNQYNTYQLGYDEKVGDSNWYIGGAISRTEGKSSFSNGSGENQSTGFTVYGTYVGDDGQYVDLSAKYARLDNEFDVFDRAGMEVNGDYRNNGYAFSAEYGKRIEAGNDFWVEPQVQLTYGHLSSANYTTSNDVKAAQDAMNSVVGRVGFAAGKDISAGNVYVKASYLYDFDGDTSVTMTKNGQSSTYDQDLGGGWFEFGIGTNINLSETSHLYFDVERAVGGDIDTPWQWNAGVRFDF